MKTARNGGVLPGYIRSSEARRCRGGFGGAPIMARRGHETEIVSSDLLRTELLRATCRGAPGQMQRARAVLDGVILLSLPSATFERAADLDPESLRSLAALHLAAALELGDELDGIITYDDRLAEAARARGIDVVAPG